MKYSPKKCSIGVAFAISAALTVWSVFELKTHNGFETSPIPKQSVSEINGETSTEISGQDIRTQRPIAEVPQLSKLNELVKIAHVAALDPDSLMLNQKLAELLGLDPAAIQIVNREIKDYTTKIFAAELNIAHIETAGDDSENIVVGPLDRSKLLEEMKYKISGALSPDIAAFLSDRLAHDLMLGATNTDLRVWIDSNHNGTDRVAITRKVLKKSAYSPDIPLSVAGPFRRGADGKPIVTTVNDSPVDTITTKSPLNDKLPLRVRHLFDAAEKLPRQQKR